MSGTDKLLANLPSQDPQYRAAMADKHQELARLNEEKLAHLGAFACNLATVELRRKFIDNFEKRNGTALANRLRDYVKTSWDARQKAKTKDVADHAGEA